MKKTAAKSSSDTKDHTTTHYTKVSMNLNQRSIENVIKLTELTGEKNKTRVVSIALELTRVILEMKDRGEKFYTRSGKTEKEMVIL